jgi:hypothetical protein
MYERKGTQGNSKRIEATGGNLSIRSGASWSVSVLNLLPLATNKRWADQVHAPVGVFDADLTYLQHRQSCCPLISSVKLFNSAMSLVTQWFRLIWVWVLLAAVVVVENALFFFLALLTRAQSY